MATEDSIFSTYKTGENRVTASILAVLKSLSLSRIERLLASLMEESGFELVRFQNQPSKGAAGVPDGMILTSSRLLLETKIARNAVNRKQLEVHLKRLDSESEDAKRLIVLTPDDQPPAAIEAIGHDDLVWSSFAALDQAIDEILTDKSEVVSEREAFLLRELQKMLVAERLVGSLSDVVVVAARHAWPEYEKYDAYVCQADRPFQNVQRIGFYSHGQVHPLIPRIKKSYERVSFAKGKFKGALGELVDRLMADGVRFEGENHKVMLLTPPDHADTVRLETQHAPACSGRTRTLEARQQVRSRHAVFRNGQPGLSFKQHRR